MRKEGMERMSRETEVHFYSFQERGDNGEVYDEAKCDCCCGRVFKYLSGTNNDAVFECASCGVVHMGYDLHRHGLPISVSEEEVRV